MNIDISLLARVETMLFLLALATVSAIVLRKFRIPYTIGLVPVGIAVAALLNWVPGLAGYRNLRLGQDLIMFVLLPALIFDASVNIDAKLLRRNLYPTLMLAAPGLVIATVVTGLAMYWLTPLGMGPSMIFGALISATDPVAVISLFEMVGAPRRLRILVDGESLFNDATAIAMFNLVLKTVIAGTALSWGAAGAGAVNFCSAFFLGILVGALFGVLMSAVMSAVGDDPHIQVALSIVLAYGTFIFADRVLQVSGVMAVLGAGVVTSYLGTTRFSERVRNQLHDFWAFLSFLANSAIFLLLGFTEENILFDFSGGATLRMIVVAILAIQIARAIVVYGLCPFLGRGGEKIGAGYQAVMFWGGLRGAVPLALVFSLPADLPERRAIMQITLAVVLFTLLIQGLTTHQLLRFFRLDQPELSGWLAGKFALLRARRDGLAKLDEIEAAQVFPLAPLQELKTEYRRKIDMLRAESATGAEEKRALGLLVRTQAAETERAVYRRSFRDGLISGKVFRRLLGLSAAEDALRFAGRRHSLSLRLAANPAVRRWLPRFTLRVMCDRITGLLAAGLAARQVLNELDAAPETEHADATDVAACRDIYLRRHQAVTEEVARLTALDPAWVERGEYFGLRRMVLTTELESIELAASRGALPSGEAEKLLDRIHFRLAALEERVSAPDGIRSERSRDNA